MSTAKAAGRAGRRIPLELLFGEPARITPQLSPDGTRLAWLAPLHGVLNLWVRPLDQQEGAPVTHEAQRGIITYFWAPDGRGLIYLLDRGGDEAWRLLAADAGGGGTRELVALAGAAVQVLGRSASRPGTLLVGLDRRTPGVCDVFRLDLGTGALELVLENPGTVVEWVADRELAVRAAVAAREDGGFDLVVPDPTPAAHAGAWRRIISWSLEDSLTSSPLGVSGTGALYVIDSRGRDTSALVEVDPADGSSRLVAHDDRHDVARAMLDPRTGKVQAVCFRRARNEWRALDPAIEADLRALAAMGQGDFFVLNRDDADRSWVVAFLADTRPIAFFVHHRDTQRTEFLFEHEPRLREYALAPMEPISFTARDGLTLHGYLTLPVGRRDGPPPLVLKVHGGPWTRDEWGFDPQVQWLVNRGFACLQVNFRGSSGYGKRLLDAGDREWGGKMQDDLVDALWWAIGRGVAAPGRIAVLGLSYGGYAALMLAAAHPELLACVVDLMGPTDLVAFLRSAGERFGNYRHVFFSRVGHPDADRALLWERSPLAQADRIHIPVLLAHGMNDPRVAPEHSELLAAQLARRGVPHELVIFGDEGHGLGKPSNRLDLYRKIEEFLARYLSPA